MIIKGDDTLRAVSGLTEAQEKSIMDFLQGAVYCWCKNNKGTYFSLLDLMGGENNDWRETPLEILNSKHIYKIKNPKKKLLIMPVGTVGGY